MKYLSSLVIAAAMLGGTAGAAQASPSHHENSCGNCGTVIAVHTYERAAEHGSGAGAVGGALVGGFLGNHVGSGNGRTLATVAGAVGGGYAGNHIEKNMRKTTVTDVKVRMANGNVRNFTENGNSHWHNGERVRIEHNQIVAER